jgi:hypothetical protein
MPRYASRERAREAFDLRVRRHSWREVCDRLGYRSVGAAQSAVARHTARERREPTTTSIEVHKAGIELRTRALDNRFAVAFRAGDDQKMVDLNRAILANEAELAKVGGFYAPEQIDVSLTADPAAVIAQARTRLLEIVDAEVVDAPPPTKEIAR